MTYTDLTEDLYAELPEAYREADAAEGEVLKKWLSSVTDQVGAVADLLDRIDWIRANDGGDPTDTSHLADPAAADDAWLPWLAQVVGVRLAPGLTAADQRTVLATPETGYKPGSKDAIAAPVKVLLTGEKFVRVYHHSNSAGGIGAGTAWDMLIVTKTEETPGGVDPVAEVIRAGSKPAGVKLWHRTYTSSWTTVETNFSTWNAWEGKTWADIESSGA